jgi:dTDP-4-dehydrorhamnose reductase
MKLLVAGAGGMLGRDVVGAAQDAGYDVVALERGDLDVTDALAVAELVSAEGPGAVVNCAAYTEVDEAEANFAAAAEVNAFGAHNVAAAAALVGAAVVYPSTDYVFDGTKREPYVESDEPRPLSEYGRTKLMGELATADANPRHIVARSSWLFGVGGPNFVESIIGLGDERDELRVVDDQIGCPTYAGHLAGALLRLTSDGAFGVHHVAAAGRASWRDFAAEILRAAGVDCRVEPQTTAELGRPAPRPAYSVLVSEREDTPRLSHWTVGLGSYLAERASVR